MKNKNLKLYTSSILFLLFRQEWQQAKNTSLKEHVHPNYNAFLLIKGKIK